MREFELLLMGKQKLDPEERERQFQQWKEGEDYKTIDRFMDERNKLPPKTIELGCIDLCYDIQPFLTAMWEMVSALKVPKKTKAGKRELMICSL
jgi:hypothetical protein